jgi:phytoene dehydrogenase-like protein
VPGLGGAATPVDRLFLAGSSAHPGGGVHGACGSNAAHAALARARATGPLRRGVQANLMKRIYAERKP